VTRPTLSGLLRRAGDERYAVPAFNIVDDLTMSAVLTTAARRGSPVIVQASTRTAEFYGPRQLRAMFVARRAASGASAVLHLDHCRVPELVLDCARAGWEPALFDGSDRDCRGAVAVTSTVVEACAAYSMEVEGEFERISSVGEDPATGTASTRRCAEFVETTGVACFSPDLGTQHGMHSDDPVLRFELAAELAALVPVVLHGGSGLSRESLRRAISAGVSKVNFSSVIKAAYVDGVREFAARGGTEPLELAGQLRDRIGEVCDLCITDVGSEGAAREGGSGERRVDLRL